MQKLMLIKDEQTLEAVNEVLAGDEFEVGQIAAGQNGEWLVLLDDDPLLSGASDFDFEYDDEDDD